MTEREQNYKRHSFIQILLTIVWIAIGLQSAIAQNTSLLPNKWPDIPLINITTINGEMPTYTKLPPP